MSVLQEVHSVKLSLRCQAQMLHKTVKLYQSGAILISEVSHEDDGLDDVVSDVCKHNERKTHAE